MSNQFQKQKQKQKQTNQQSPSESVDYYEQDILNDSISMNMVDDSFEYDNTFVPTSSKSTGGSSSTQQKKIIPSETHNYQNTQEIRPRTPQKADPSRPPQKLLDHKSFIRRETLRNQDLEKERDWLREINALLLKSADSMDKVKEKLQNVQSATQTSHELLDLYSKILTQTEHTKDLLSNPNWRGLTDDMERIAQIKDQERQKLERQRVLEEEQAIELERQRRQREVEAEAERLRRQQIQKPNNYRTGTSSSSSAIPTSNYPRGRGSARGTTAGRTVRGKSRISRITR